MSENLIKRSDAIKALYKYDFVSKGVIEREIEAIPSVDRPQGEWIEMYRNGFGNMIYMCSKCSFHATKSNFCPNCGAHMKGADDETE